jgi:hypothetical protein
MHQQAGLTGYHHPGWSSRHQNTGGARALLQPVLSLPAACLDQVVLRISASKYIHLRIHDIIGKDEARSSKVTDRQNQFKSRQTRASDSLQITLLMPCFWFLYKITSSNTQNVVRQIQPILILEPQSQPLRTTDNSLNHVAFRWVSDIPVHIAIQEK